MNRRAPRVETPDYAAHYSERTLRRKLGRYAVVAGRELIEKVLWLYYAAIDPDTPLHARVTAFSALGYFILPTDLVPDLIPVAGYGDDLGAVALALGVIAAHIKPEHRAKADVRLARWFGAGRP